MNQLQRPVCKKRVFAVWPVETNLESEAHYSDLLDDLIHFGITTASDLFALIDEHYDNVMVEEMKAMGQHACDFEGFYTFSGLTRVVLECRWPEEWNRYRATAFKPQVSPGTSKPTTCGHFKTDSRVNVQCDVALFPMDGKSCLRVAA